MDWSYLPALAPFIGRAALERLVGKVTEGELDARQIMALAPFLGKEMLDQLVNHAAKGNIDWDIIQGLCPFIDRATLSRLVQQESISNPDSGIIVGLAPFLDQSDLAFLVKRIQSGQLNPKHLSALAPFLQKELLHQLVLPFKIVEVSYFIESRKAAQMGSLSLFRTLQGITRRWLHGECPCLRRREGSTNTDEYWLLSPLPLGTTLNSTGDFDSLKRGLVDSIKL